MVHKSEGCAKCCELLPKELRVVAWVSCNPTNKSSVKCTYREKRPDYRKYFHRWHRMETRPESSYRATWGVAAKSQFY